mgnify:CR=1 FL=1
MPVRVSEILPGNPGILQTARRMLAMIASPSPLATAQAGAIASALPPLAPASLLVLAVFRWVQEHMVYTHDGAAPESVPVPGAGEEPEELRSPEYLLRGIANYGADYGDCDDFVILLGALLRSLGIPFALVLTSGRPDREFDHVFLKVDTEGGPVYADPIQRVPVGWHVPWNRVTAYQELRA